MGNEEVVTSAAVVAGFHAAFQTALLEWWRPYVVRVAWEALLLIRTISITKSLGVLMIDKAVVTCRDKGMSGKVYAMGVLEDVGRAIGEMPPWVCPLKALRNGQYHMSRVAWRRGGLRRSS